MSKKPYHNNSKPKTVKIFGSQHTYMKFPKNTSLDKGLEILTETLEEPSTSLTD